MNLDKTRRLLAILARADREAFEASATFARYTAEGIEVTLIEPVADRSDTGQIICELVAHVRRVRPQVVITSGPWDASGDDRRSTTSQLATAAVMCAADPRYGHTCCSRGAHSVSKLYYTAARGPVTTRIDSDTFYRVFSTVNTERPLEVEADLFDGLRDPTRQFAAAA
jgi:LmbE family N-acetylglucosaminyl deacetylase